MIAKLHTVLKEIAARRQRQRFNGGLALVWWLGLLVGVLIWLAGVPVKFFIPALAVVLLAGSVGVFFWSRRGLGDPRAIARNIETKHPELQTALLAALDQNPDPETGSLSFLQSRLVVDSLASAERDRWVELVPRPQLTMLRGLHLAGLFFFSFVACLMLLSRPAKAPEAVAAVRTTAAVLDFKVDPGDVEIERGSPLTVQARFGAAVPASASLETTDEAGVVQAIPLARPFTDPVYQARLAAVAGPLTYRVTTPEGASRAYTVRVFDLPALLGSEVVLYPPDHLGKAPETLKEPRVVQIAERTRVEISLVVNLPGLEASLVAKNQEPVKLVADGAQHRISLTPAESVRYEIVLTDSAGRRNARGSVLEIKVLPNKAPVVKVVLPRKNEKATPIQEVRLEARVTDDAAVLAHGLRYTLDGAEWHEVAGTAAPADKSPLLSHLVDLEAADAVPNDVIMWNAWAEDLGPDGKARRVNGDIHLVRVRDFDEEFYQQAAPPGGGGPPPPGAELVKVQTKILNSTWNLRRDHTEISTTPPAVKDLETLQRAQEIAIETAAKLEAEQSDPAVRQFLTDARLAMKDAAASLAEAVGKTSAAPLDAAIGHEQTALRHLYRLMSSKTMIMTGGEGEGSESEDSAEKEDLDLKPMENSYQAEKEAKPESSGQANEAMEILKRLDELAKRQRDLNEEMQALQMALNQADTPEKKAEIERQLKQLRDQQRELLADVDKLKEKTSEAAAEPQQDKALDEAREKARQANEQLGENKLGEALAAGRRAQESLEKLHEDFRETSAAQLAEQLRDLREDARELEARQKQLGENEPEEKAPGLGASPETAEISRQREDLKKLLDALKETAMTAEKAEPLVAQDLAEALRKADQNKVAQAMEQMGNSAPGQPDPAADHAAKGLAELTREIEGAAERILGNEAQALRYASDELKRLAEQAGGEAPGKGTEPGKGEAEGEAKEQTAGQAPKPNGKPGEGEGKGEGDAKGEGEGEGQASNESGKPGSEPGEGKGQTPSATPGKGPGGPGNSGPGGSAITGRGYEQWSERLTDLEAVVQDPEAQSAVARARKAGREMRKDFNRHAREPDQERVEQEILRPLAEAAKELDARLMELSRKDPLAPVGRDPVPERYTEIVRRYFEELGK